MGLISDFLPALYHGNGNDITEFVKQLEPEIADLERKIGGIASLIDVDRCPNEYLPYLAALTNVPLLGDSPNLWRRQIRNWPWLLKLKGTQKSLELCLNSIGASDCQVKTYFRDGQGEYTEEKPAGEPFFDAGSGLWRNIRTHCFDISVVWGDLHFFSWTEWDADFANQIAHWLERAKPFHSELLRIIHRIIFDFGGITFRWRGCRREYRLERDAWEKAYYELKEMDEAYSQSMRNQLSGLRVQLDNERAAWKSALRKSRSPGFGVFAGAGYTASGQVEGVIGVGWVWKIF
jgi:phage tail-like protein